MRYVTRPFSVCLILLTVMWVGSAAAELKELDDETLEDQKGQAGITIDLEFEMSIGEVAWQFGDSNPNLKRQKGQTFTVQQPPRIEYVLPGDK